MLSRIGKIVKNVFKTKKQKEAESIAKAAQNKNNIKQKTKNINKYYNNTRKKQSQKLNNSVNHIAKGKYYYNLVINELHSFYDFLNEVKQWNLEIEKQSKISLLHFMDDIKKQIDKSIIILQNKMKNKINLNSEILESIHDIKNLINFATKTLVNKILKIFKNNICLYQTLIQLHYNFKLHPFINKQYFDNITRDLAGIRNKSITKEFLLEYCKNLNHTMINYLSYNSKNVSDLIDRNIPTLKSNKFTFDNSDESLGIDDPFTSFGEPGKGKYNLTNITKWYKSINPEFKNINELADINVSALQFPIAIIAKDLILSHMLSSYPDKKSDNITYRYKGDQCESSSVNLLSRKPTKTYIESILINIDNFTKNGYKYRDFVLIILDYISFYSTGVLFEEGIKICKQFKTLLGILNKESLFLFYPIFYELNEDKLDAIQQIPLVTFIIRNQREKLAGMYISPVNSLLGDIEKNSLGKIDTPLDELKEYFSNKQSEYTQKQIKLISSVMEKNSSSNKFSMIKSRTARTNATIDDNLLTNLELFKVYYFYNLMYDDKSNARSTIINKNKYDVTFEKYKKYLLMIYNIQCHKSPIEEHINYLLNYNMNCVKNYLEIPKSLDNTQITYLECHGAINKSRFQIPDNLVLVLVTPINYLQSTILNEDLLKKLSENREYFVNNVLCLGKDDKSLNNNLIRESVVFLPGQVCYDIKLNFDFKDILSDDIRQQYIKLLEEKKNLEHEYAKNKSTIIWFKIMAKKNQIMGFERKNKKTKNTTPHNLGFFDIDKSEKGYTKRSQPFLNKKLSDLCKDHKNDRSPDGKLKYLIVNCCRPLPTIKKTDPESKIQLNQKIYLNENFIYYFNTILGSCYSFKDIIDIFGHLSIIDKNTRRFNTSDNFKRKYTNKRVGKSGRKFLTYTIKQLQNNNSNDDELNELKKIANYFDNKTK